MYNKYVWDVPSAKRRLAEISSSALTLSTNALSQISFKSTIVESFTHNSIISPNFNGEYEILGAGAEISENLHDCSFFKLKCLEGEGTDKACSAYKCVYGYLKDYSEDLWIYESYYSYNSEKITLYYEKSDLIRLSKITRGTYSNIPVHFPASPSGFLSFFKLPKPQIAESQRESLYRRVINRAFNDICKNHEACIISNAQSITNISLVYYGAITVLYDINATQYWINYFRDWIKSKDLTSYSTSSALVTEIILEFIYLDSTFLQLTNSKTYNQSIISPNSHSYPIYSRLPGVYKKDELDNVLYTTNLDVRLNLDFEPDLGYRVVSGNIGYTYLPRKILDPDLRDLYGLPPHSKEKLFSSKDPESWVKFEDDDLIDVSRYILSGIDAELYSSKNKMDSFYANVLNPDTSYEKTLDWVASLIGLFPPVWDTSLTSEDKRAIIKNTLGWNSLETTVINILGQKAINIKGQVMTEYPFSNYLEYWTNEEDSDNYLFYDFTSLSPRIRVYDDETQLVTTQNVDNLIVPSAYWEGLYATKGTFLNILWWNMLLQVEAFSPSDELELWNSELGIYKVKTYMNFEFKDLNIPIMFSYAQTGSNLQAQLNSFTNQFICGLSTIYNINEIAQGCYVCLPFKYSRNGDLWRKLENLYEYWAPIYNKPRVQYGVFVAGYSAADDIFLEHE